MPAWAHTLPPFAGTWTGSSVSTSRDQIKDTKQGIWYRLLERRTTSTPQLPSKVPQIHIPSNRDHKALNGGTLGVAGKDQA